MNRLGQILRRKVSLKRNQQFSSKRPKTGKLPLTRDVQACDQESIGDKTKKKNFRTPSFLRNIFACYAKDNNIEEMISDKEQLDRRSSAQSGELSKINENKVNEKMDNPVEQHFGEKPSLSSQPEDGELPHIVPIETERKFKRHKRTAGKSKSLPIQHKQSSHSFTIHKEDQHSKADGRTSKKRVVKSASYGPDRHRHYHTYQRSPMLIYQSSGTIISKRGSIQTVYFPNPITSVPKQLRGHQSAGAQVEKQNSTDVYHLSNTNPQRYQMPSKFLANIEQAKKDCHNSIAVYRVHCEKGTTRVYHSNALKKQNTHQECRAANCEPNGN